MIELRGNRGEKGRHDIADSLWSATVKLARAGGWEPEGCEINVWHDGFCDDPRCTGRPQGVPVSCPNHEAQPPRDMNGYKGYHGRWVTDSDAAAMAEGIEKAVKSGQLLDCPPGYIETMCAFLRDGGFGIR